MWQYRPSADALEPLLLFAVVIGAAHVVLGVGLGAWQARASASRGRCSTSSGPCSPSAASSAWPGGPRTICLPGAITPSVAATIVGLVLVMSLHGALGIVTGALEFVGAIGNILSYLRLAAVGLASAHLAAVANELGTVGPIWMGVLVAVFFHSLNLALASFSPLIQALRLHYVEFFGTFLVGGGRAFSPFGHRRELQTPPTN